MDTIRHAIEKQNYTKAFDLLKEYIAFYPAYTDTIAILEASIYIGLGDFHAALPSRNMFLVLLTKPAQ